MKRILAWIKLTSIASIGLSKALQLVRQYGEPEDFLGSPASRFSSCDYLSKEAVSELSKPFNSKEFKNEARLIEKLDIRFVSLLDDEYPALLKSIYYPPLYLFYRGELRMDDFRRVIAVVGTRRPSNYGRLMAEKICDGLTRAGFTIISGMAHGIDTISHRSALGNGGKTYAVLGTPVDHIYPAGNRELSEEIMQHGAIISEFVPGSKSAKGNFPRRNRIISGLSLGTVVIEGSQTSGALITSKYATDQNRDVFALPGDVNRVQAEGPNQLIQQGATLITSAEDVMGHYGVLPSADDQISVFPELNPREEAVYRVLVEHKPEVDIDSLYVLCEMPISELSTVLLGLDLKGVIKRMPGNKIAPLY